MRLAARARVEGELLSLELRDADARRAAELPRRREAALQHLVEGTAYYARLTRAVGRWQDAASDAWWAERCTSLQVQGRALEEAALRQVAARLLLLCTTSVELASADALGRWARAAVAMRRDEARAETAAALATLAQAEAAAASEGVAMQAAMERGQQLSLQQAERLSSDARHQAHEADALRASLYAERAAAAAAADTAAADAAAASRDAAAEMAAAEAAALGERDATRDAARAARLAGVLSTTEASATSAALTRWRTGAAAAAMAALHAAQLRLPRLLLLRSMVAAERAAELRGALGAWRDTVVALSLAERSSAPLAWALQHATNPASMPEPVARAVAHPFAKCHCRCSSVRRQGEVARR